MKSRQLILLLFLVLSFTHVIDAQQGINYKAIIHDDSGNALANIALTVQFTILENGATNVYRETHTSTTDANGIVIVNIGEGTVVGGDFSAIDWGSNPHFLKTEIDKGEGLTEIGTTEFKTVPYALHAKTVDKPNNSLAIGDFIRGGIIFYLDASGQHGLIAAATDQSTGIRWGAYSIFAKAFSSSVGGGHGNTSLIVSVTALEITNAAKLCASLRILGTSDWYLPSRYELYLMYRNIGQGNLLGLGNVGGFANANYWSSNEYNIKNAWALRFSSFGATESVTYKSGEFHVRAIRAF